MTCTGRRDFFRLLGGGATVGWPLAARAQQQTIPVVGILNSAGDRWVAAFRKGLSEEGQIEGRNVAIELRSTAQYGEVPSLAAELVQRRVAVFAALGGPAAAAAKAATATLPIVFSVGGDPVELGLVPNINRPGGNITGVTFFAKQLLQKQVGILHDLVPKVSVLGVLINPNNWRHQADTDEVQAAARTLGLDLHVAKAGSEGDLDAAFTGLVQHHAQALVIAGDAFFFRVSTKLVALAEQHSLAAIFPTREFADAGGLMSYAASLADAHRQAGVYVGRILKGEKPGDLPVMQPSKFELVINLKTAKALGLEIPPGVLALTDEVVE
jgi:putative tryptophan/tyrosine transport system substrate-binding protein